MGRSLGAGSATPEHLLVGPAVLGHLARRVANLVIPVPFAADACADLENTGTGTFLQRRSSLYPVSCVKIFISQKNQGSLAGCFF